MSLTLNASSLDGTVDLSFALGAEAASLGKDENCDFVVAHDSIAGVHLQFEPDGDSYTVRLREGKTGLFVNGVEVEAATIGPGDLLEVGELRIVCTSLEDDETLADWIHAAENEKPPEPRDVRPVRGDFHSPARTGDADPDSETEAPGVTGGSRRLGRPPKSDMVRNLPLEEPKASMPAPAVTESETVPSSTVTLRLRSQMRNMLLERLGLRDAKPSLQDIRELKERSRTTATQIVREFDKAGRVPAGVSTSELAREVIEDALGFGPIEGLLRDRHVEEIFVNGPGTITVTRNGKCELTDKTYIDTSGLRDAVDRLFEPVDRKLGPGEPVGEARLANGLIVRAAIPPVTPSGPVLSIRRGRITRMTAKEYVSNGAMHPAMLRFLVECLKLRQNVLISGLPASGRSTLLNIVGHYLPGPAMVALVEKGPTLQINKKHVAVFRIRGDNAVEVLARVAAMRPANMLVSDCGRAEALSVLDAMGGEAPGVAAVLTSSSPADALERFAQLVACSEDLPVALEVARSRVTRSVNVIAHLECFPDGRRRVASIDEVVTGPGREAVLNPIFVLTRPVREESGNRGEAVFRATGYVPSFFEKAIEWGARIPREIFEVNREDYSI